MKMDEILKLTAQMTAIIEYSTVLLFPRLFLLTFPFVGEILKWNHWAVRSCGTVYCAAQGAVLAFEPWTVDEIFDHEIYWTVYFPVALFIALCSVVLSSVSVDEILKVLLFILKLGFSVEQFVLQYFPISLFSLEHKALLARNSSTYLLINLKLTRKYRLFLETLYQHFPFSFKTRISK